MHRISSKLELPDDGEIRKRFRTFNRGALRRATKYYVQKSYAYHGATDDALDGLLDAATPRLSGSAFPASIPTDNGESINTVVVSSDSR